MRMGCDVPTGGVAEAKAALRRRLLDARAALPADARAAASARVVAQLSVLPELAGARAVLGFAAFGSEVNVDAWLRTLLGRELGVFLPFVDGSDLGIARIDDLDADVAPGWRGVREPRALGRRPARPDRVDAAVIPGVGFDRHGARLGYGGGHFDRLLARLAPGTPVVGVAFAAQVVRRLPIEPHDRPIGVLVTEDQVVRPGRGGDT
jgi:5-formyltetrahydrofolate cyclo-ligase